MPIKKSVGLALAGLLLFALGGVSLLGQTGGTPHMTQAKEIKSVPISRTNPSSGALMYKSYCAACHGMEGKGDGPAAKFLKTAPPDLRTLAVRNHGNYPALTVKSTLLFRTKSHAQGTIDMPFWGHLFRSLHPDVTEMRAYNLTEYVKSLQQK